VNIVRSSCVLLLIAAEAWAGPGAQESRVAVPGASLYVRTIGHGTPVIVLHGGPDFDTAYLLPDLDRLADAYRLIYYDQRGRGRSAAGVRAEDVTLASELADLDAVRRHFGLEAPAILGHSFGTVLALEYALRYPGRQSKLILLSPAPASAADVAVLRDYYLRRIGAQMAKQREIVAGAAYKAGDPGAVQARYRIHFRPAFAAPAPYERLMAAMGVAFREQGAAGILLARAIEDRLYVDTWQIAGYDLHPKLRTLDVPTLVTWGEDDFIPLDIAEHAAAAIPGAKLVKLEHCGHFTFIECPRATRAAVDEFLRGRASASSPGE
jgi:proline iminopeptidase